MEKQRMTTRERKIKEIQNIIKRGCASGRPYPWCNKDTDCSPKVCWYWEAKAIYHLLGPKPSLLAGCKCGHPLDEHDWGAYRKDEAGCLVVNCPCESFDQKEAKRQRNEKGQFVAT